MDQEVNSKLNDIKQIVTDNNVLLKKLVQQGKIALWSKIVYWVLLILVAIGEFALVKPMFSSLSSVYMPEGASSSFTPSATLNAINELRSQFEE